MCPLRRQSATFVNQLFEFARRKMFEARQKVHRIFQVSKPGGRYQRHPLPPFLDLEHAVGLVRQMTKVSIHILLEEIFENAHLGMNRAFQASGYPDSFVTTITRQFPSDL
jgi:hypothetical protein